MAETIITFHVTIPNFPAAYNKRYKPEFDFTVPVKKAEEDWYISAGYGYQFHSQNCQVEGERYRLHLSIPVKTGDIWERNGRRFRVGPVTGFLIYTAPLISEETGEPVAQIRFESYYKD